MSFVFSQSGSLVYVPGPVSPSQQALGLFDRKGGVEALNLPGGRYAFPRVSPDGKRIVFETTAGKEAVVSNYDLSRASSVRRLTFGGNNRFPIWSFDGSHVTFQSDRDGRSRGLLAARRRRHRGTPHEARTGHVAHAGVVVSRRQPLRSRIRFRCLGASALPFHRARERTTWMADGRFVGVAPQQSQLGSGPAQIRVVLNWTEELKRLVPTR